MLKCLAKKLMVEKLLQLNKKLENLKLCYLKVKDYIKRQKKQD